MAGLLLCLVAAAVGSFLACAAVRLPQGKGMGGRSACPHCGRTLRVVELIPVLSWVGQRGRCRSCGMRLSRLYPAVELGAVAVAVLAALLSDGWSFIGLLIVGWAGLFACSVLVVRHRRM